MNPPVGAAAGAGAPNVDCPNPPVGVGAVLAAGAPPNWNTPVDAPGAAAVLLLLPKLKTPG